MHAAAQNRVLSRPRGREGAEHVRAGGPFTGTGSVEAGAFCGEFPRGFWCIAPRAKEHFMGTHPLKVAAPRGRAPLSAPRQDRTDVEARRPDDGCGRPDHGRLEARAYEIFENRRRTGQAGDAISDWLQAERELEGSAACGT